MSSTLKRRCILCGREFMAVSEQTAPVLSLAITPEVHFAMSGSWDDTVRVGELT